MKYAFILILIFSFSFSFSQYRKSKTKRSWSAGTLFFYWGYNRSFYTKSNINFNGAGYNFTLNGAKAVDRPSKEIDTYFSINKFTVPQFNFRIGYNIKNNWAISIGYDHMKYVLVDNEPYTLSGYIKPGVDNVTNWSGNYNNEPVITKEETFHYENSNGLNYIRFEVSRIDQWFRSQGGEFAFSSSFGLSTGGILSFNDFTFAGQKDVQTVSMSGLGLSLHTGARFEFWKHFFMQVNGAAGFMNQMNVDTRPNDYNSFAKQKFGYSALEVVAGGLFYFKPKKGGCDSCPQWGK
jgi:hypothetical protein